MPVSAAFCPAGISSFFEVCDIDSFGNAITDPARIGARGGGFGIARGVDATVTTKKASESRISLRINSKPAPEALTTRWALNEILRTKRIDLEVHVNLRVRVPIEAGFGTSAAGTLASCLALTDAANTPITMNDLGKITHIAEVKNQTGLGTAAALLVGGFVLVTEPGAPGIGLVDRLSFPREHLVICGYLGPISTRNILGRSSIASKVNPLARRALDAIRTRPELRVFLNEARQFGDAAGFQTPDVLRLIQTMLSAGAVGAAQNMVGNAVHGVIDEEEAPRAIKILRKAFPSALIFASPLDYRGVRLIQPRNPKH